MKLLDLNPFEVHFGDPGLESNWQDWRTVEPKLIEDITKNGIKNPIIVYEIANDKHLTSRIRMRHARSKDYKPEGYWCWRGTQRLRIARQLELPIIKALLLDGEPETREVKKYFECSIRVFHNRTLKRWDIESL